VSLAFGMRPGAAPRVCSACGARSRADRPRCLRCGASLAGSSVETQPAPSTGTSRALIGAAAAGVVLVCGAVYALHRPDPPKAVAAAPGPAAQPATAAQARAVDAAAAPANGSLQHGREALLGGNAAYKTGDMTGALASFERAVDANPTDPEALNNLAQVLERGGRASEAIPLFRRAVALDPDRWSYHFNLAHAISRTGDWNGAIAEYREADRLFPDDHVTLFNLGLALQKTGNHAGAIESLARAVALAPDEPDFLLALGQSYLAAGHPEDGRRTLEQYLTLAPASHDAALVRALLERAGP